MIMHNQTTNESHLGTSRHLLAFFPGLPTVEFLICLQYAKMEGEGRSGPFYNGNDVSVYLGRQRERAVPDQMNELKIFPYSIRPSAGVLNDREMENLPFVAQDKGVCKKVCSFNWNTPPPPP